MMQIVRENLFVVVAVGVIAGWLVGHFVRGMGFGILGDVVAGIAGAFVGGWLLPEPNVRLGPERIAGIFNASAGALLFLFAIGMLRAAIARGSRRRGHEWRWL